MGDGIPDKVKEATTGLWSRRKMAGCQR